MRCTRGQAIQWLGIVMLLAAGCDSLPPPEPTVAPTRTATVTATAAPVTPSVTPSDTPIPTETVLPTATRTPGPTITLGPSRTPRPPTATPNPSAAATSQIEANPIRGTNILLTEAQINAAMAEAFDGNPIVFYSLAPRASLGFGFLTLHLQIAPSAGGPVQSVQLLAQVGQTGGFVETIPTELIPLHSGVETWQVKRGEALLRDTLEVLARRALGAGDVLIFFTSAQIRPEGVTLTVIRAGE